METQGIRFQESGFLDLVMGGRWACKPFEFGEVPGIGRLPVEVVRRNRRSAPGGKFPLDLRREPHVAGIPVENGHGLHGVGIKPEVVAVDECARVLPGDAGDGVAAGFQAGVRAFGKGRQGVVLGGGNLVFSHVVKPALLPVSLPLEGAAESHGCGIFPEPAVRVAHLEPAKGEGTVIAADVNPPERHGVSVGHGKDEIALQRLGVEGRGRHWVEAECQRQKNKTGHYFFYHSHSPLEDET